MIRTKLKRAVDRVNEAAEKEPMKSSELALLNWCDEHIGWRHPIIDGVHYFTMGGFKVSSLDSLLAAFNYWRRAAKNRLAIVGPQNGSL